jgi:hypothetical protein
LIFNELCYQKWAQILTLKTQKPRFFFTHQVGAGAKLIHP